MAATTSVKVAGTWNTVTQPHAKVAGTWQPLKEIWARVAGVWQLVYQAFSATVSPTTLSGSGSTGVYVSTSGASTCTPVGGTPTYTYSWVYVSGDVLTANSPTSASCNFGYFNAIPGTKVGVFKCTVTDSASQVVDSNTVTATITHT